MIRFDDERVLAARVAGAANLDEVRLFNVDATLDQLPTGAGGLSYDFSADVEVQQVTDSNTLIVDGRYKLVVHFSSAADSTDEADQSQEISDDSDQHQHIAHLNFQLAALYALPDDDAPQFPDEELHAFGQTTGLLTLHPYAREFVSSMTGRMGLPSLHLGTMRFNIDRPDPTDT